MDFLAAARAYQAEMIQDLETLVNIPSLLDEKTIEDGAPFGLRLKEVLTTALDIGKRDGFKTKNVDGYAGIIEYGTGAEAVGVLGHLDVVPVSNDWQHKPFVSTLENGILFGRGSADDKGPTIAAYYALRLLKDAKISTNKRIQLIMGCDEETGMRGMQYFKSHEEIPSCGFVPDAVFPVVYAEKGILDLAIKGQVTTVIKKLVAGQRPNIVIAEADVIVDDGPKEELFAFYLLSNHLTGNIEKLKTGTKYHIKGVGAHGARPYLGVNAAWHLLNFVGSAYQDNFAQKTAYLLKDWMAGNLNNRIDGVHMGFLSMNLGIVAIDNGNVDLTLDIRYPNDTTSAIIISNIQTAFINNDYPLAIQILTDKTPLFIDPNSELITILESTYRKFSEDYFTPNRTMSGGTYARTLPNFAAYGPTFPNRQLPKNVGIAHEDDEGVEIESLILACAIYADALYQLTR